MIAEEKKQSVGEVRKSLVSLKEDLTNCQVSQGWEAGLSPGCFQQGGELLTLTRDTIARWKEQFEDPLNPSDIPFCEEAELDDTGKLH